MDVDRPPLGGPGDVVVARAADRPDVLGQVVLEDRHVARDAALGRCLPDDRRRGEPGLRPGRAGGRRSSPRSGGGRRSPGRRGGRSAAPGPASASAPGSASGWASGRACGVGTGVGGRLRRGGRTRARGGRRTGRDGRGGRRAAGAPPDERAARDEPDPERTPRSRRPPRRDHRPVASARSVHSSLHLDARGSRIPEPGEPRRAHRAGYRRSAERGPLPGDRAPRRAGGTLDVTRPSPVGRDRPPARTCHGRPTQRHAGATPNRKAPTAQARRRPPAPKTAERRRDRQASAHVRVTPDARRTAKPAGGDARRRGRRARHGVARSRRRGSGRRRDDGVVRPIASRSTRAALDTSRRRTVASPRAASPGRGRPGRCPPGRHRPGRRDRRGGQPWAASRSPAASGSRLEMSAVGLCGRQRRTRQPVASSGTSSPARSGSSRALVWTASRRPRDVRADQRRRRCCIARQVDGDVRTLLDWRGALAFGGDRRPARAGSSAAASDRAAPGDPRRDRQRRPRTILGSTPAALRRRGLGGARPPRCARGAARRRRPARLP